MARRKKERGKEMRMNLTPLIDVVFQLIIFFMLVMDLVKQEREPNISLPPAYKAVKDEPGPEKRLIINVMRNGDFKIHLRVWNQDQLKGLIAKENNEAKRLGQTVMKNGQELSNMLVKIRADSEVAWKKVQQVMTACMENKVWRISFGVLPSDAQKQ